MKPTKSGALQIGVIHRSPHTIEDANDPAFRLGFPGMTMRQWYAGQTLTMCYRVAICDRDASEIASAAFEIADAMLAFERSVGMKSSRRLHHHWSAFVQLTWDMLQDPPTAEDDHGRMRCAFCWSHKEKEEHDDDCIISRARYEIGVRYFPA